MIAIFLAFQNFASSTRWRRNRNRFGLPYLSREPYCGGVRATASHQQSDLCAGPGVSNRIPARWKLHAVSWLAHARDGRFTRVAAGHVAACFFFERRI